MSKYAEGDRVRRVPGKVYDHFAGKSYRISTILGTIENVGFNYMLVKWDDRSEKYYNLETTALEVVSCKNDELVSSYLEVLEDE